MEANQVIRKLEELKRRGIIVKAVPAARYIRPCLYEFDICSTNHVEASVAMEVVDVTHLLAVQQEAKVWLADNCDSEG